MSKKLKAHVTYGDSKRILSFQKGDEVKSLRQLFLRTFSDKLSDETAPGQVIFQQYDDDFKDYVDLSKEEKLEEHIKLRAVVSVKETAADVKPLKWRCDVFPCDEKCRIYRGTDLVGPIFERYHKILANTDYRFWSAVSRNEDSLMRVDPTTKIVSCSGSFDLSDNGMNTIVKTYDAATKSNPYLVGLTFQIKEVTYAMTANGKGAPITCTEIPTNGLNNKSIFDPCYYWSYTMFRNIYYDKLFLGCDKSGILTLVVMDNLDYPNPQTMFIANGIDLYTAQYEDSFEK